MSDLFVMDACAMIALLKNEAGANVVASVYKKAKDSNAKIIINRINLLEVYYGFYNADGKEYADRVLSGIEQSIISVTEFDEILFPIAGRLKASYRISLADSIALAQAMVTGGELLTSDHHEFDTIEGNEPITFHWVR